MQDRIKREQDILQLIEGLDISPTMHKNATEKYEAVGTFLQEQGLECDIFPQGSFSLGTVVRPYRDSKEMDYDLDFICCINQEKKKTNPKYIKNIVKEKLCNSEIYKSRLQSQEWDKCWTLQYAEINNIGFNIDIVPAVPEAADMVGYLQQSNLDTRYAEIAVAITEKQKESYRWVTSNPRAYKLWFDTVNKPFLQYSRKLRIEKSRSIYNTIEEIPENMERSSLQRVIQILKHHRDVYYCRIGKEKLKPTSAIITTICTEIASILSPTMGVFELLKNIANDFEIYAKNQTMTEEQFAIHYQYKNTIRKRGGKWYIMNPVNPTDNLADSWNETPEKAKLFFEWVTIMKGDFLDSMQLEDNDFVTMLENNFGSNYVNRSIDIKKYENKAPQIITSTPKPWRQ